MNKISPSFSLNHILPLLLLILILTGCLSSRKDNLRMDRAERLMESAPDSAKIILDSITLDALSSERDKARYALLRSMALDKNFIDTITFDVLQPAIDYYLEKGTPDERLRTLYYQGRIYQNRKEDEEAMKCFIAATDLKEEIRDSIIMGRVYVAQSFIFDKQGMNNSYIRSSLSAAEICRNMNMKDRELEYICHAINGHIWEGLKTGADSLMVYAKELAKEIDDISGTWLHTQIIYSLDFTPNQISSLLLDSIGTQVLGYLEDKTEKEGITLDLAYGYQRLGNTNKAWEYLEKVDSVDERLLLKYLVIKGDVLEAKENYQETVNVLRITMEINDSISNEIYSQEIESVGKRYILEKLAFKEKESKDKAILIVIIMGLILILVFLVSSRLIRKITSKNWELAEENSRLEESSRKFREENYILSSENEEILKRNLLLKEESKRLIQENSELVDRNIKLKTTSQTLQTEKENAERERDENLKEFRRINKEIILVRKECEGLSELINVQQKLSESLKRINKENASLITSYFASKIPAADKQAKIFLKLDKAISENRELFLNELQNQLQNLAPDFMNHLFVCNLTPFEIRVICLYALGLNGKEIGAYMGTSRHYNISSEIRKKLNLDSDNPNIGQYVISKIR